ncbi:MAG: FkbM family methyltransferase [Nanoarchaeota archaeon]|nr:FkbM family methyltransferase [Nanoarchaeota archaeon]
MFFSGQENAVFCRKDGGGLHSFYKESHHKKEILVPAFKLDTLVKKNNINDIKFIKIDVEGSELEVIRGALKTLDKFHPKIIFECADDEKLDDIIEILEKMNYKVFQLPSIRDFLAH